MENNYKNVQTILINIVKHPHYIYISICILYNTQIYWNSLEMQTKLNIQKIFKYSKTLQTTFLTFNEERNSISFPLFLPNYHSCGVFPVDILALSFIKNTWRGEGVSFGNRRIKEELKTKSTKEHKCFSHLELELTFLDVKRRCDSTAARNRPLRKD